MRVLFVCTMGRLRSKTAHHYFLGLSRFGGTSVDADYRVSEEDIMWADKVVCMEMGHRTKLRRRFKGYSGKVCVWGIEDIYEYMDRGLLLILEQRFNDLTGSLTYTDLGSY